MMAKIVKKKRGGGGGSEWHKENRERAGKRGDRRQSERRYRREGQSLTVFRHPPSPVFRLGPVSYVPVVPILFTSHFGSSNQDTGSSSKVNLGVAESSSNFRWGRILKCIVPPFWFFTRSFQKPFLCTGLEDREAVPWTEGEPGVEGDCDFRWEHTGDRERTLLPTPELLLRVCPPAGRE